MIITLFFIGLTIFLIVKLNEVIGLSIGHNYTDEQKEGVNKHFEATPTADFENAQTVEEKALLLQKEFSEFDLNLFKEKATQAFKMIFKAYSNGDKTTLKELLTPNMYKAFEMAIKDREEKKQSLSGSLEGVNSVEISDISIDAEAAYIHVKFDTEQVNIVRDSSGQIIEGNADFVDNIKETWVFFRERKNQNKKWFLSEIKND